VGNVRITEKAYVGGSPVSWPWKKLVNVVWAHDRGRCQRCGAGLGRVQGQFVVHHVDHDPFNNHPLNLVVVCTPCHGDLHSSKGEPGGRTVKRWREAGRQIWSRRRGCADHRIPADVFRRNVRLARVLDYDRRCIANERG